MRVIQGGLAAAPRRSADLVAFAVAAAFFVCAHAIRAAVVPAPEGAFFVLGEVSGDVPADVEDQLSAVLASELRRLGVYEPRSKRTVYVDLSVTVGPAMAAGMRPVALVWRVRDGKSGKVLGSVHAKNDVPAWIDVWREIVAEAVPASARGIRQLAGR